MQTSVKERLIEFLRYKKIGQRTFARSINKSDGYVNAIRQSIQPDTIHSISMQYPELNIGWLLSGEGTMLKEENKNIQEELTAPTIELSQLNISELIETLNKQTELLHKQADIIKTLLEQIKTK